MRAGKCKFFTGLQHKTCDAGINYDTFTGQIPCIRKYMRGYEPQGAAPCDKYTEPDEEEIAKSRAEVDAIIARFKLASPLICKVKREHKGESWKGVETCPACGGKLHLTHAGFNGHVWGHCETENCLSWIE